MDKYAVEQPEATNKTAATAAPRECPVCKTPVSSLDTTNVLVCPKCGSKPFEVAK